MFYDRTVPAGSPARVAARAFRAQGWILPVVLTKAGQTFEVRLQPFVPLRQPFLRRIKEDADRLGEFLGGRVLIAT